MFQDSKDVLNLLLGISIAWVAIWLSWLLYQAAKTLQMMNQTFARFQKLAQALEDGVDHFKNKASNVAAYATVAMKTGQEILKMVQNKRSSGTKKTKTEK